MALYYVPQYKSTLLSVAGGIDNSQTSGIVLSDITNIDATKPGICCVNWSDPLDTDICEFISYTSINESTKELNGVTRGEEGVTAKAHNNGVAVAFTVSKSHINNPNDLLTGVTAGIKVKTALYDTNGNEVIKTPATSSAVNELTVTNAATGSGVDLSATGGDTNIDLSLTPKGSGGVSVQDGYVSSTHTMARQAIMNGNFDVWQRGTSFSPSDGAIVRTADRWLNYAADDSGTLPTITEARAAITPGDIPNSFYHYRLTTNGAGSSLGVNSLHVIGQRIEYGTRFLAGNGKKVTLSFYARSSITNKKLGVYLSQNYGTGGSPTSGEIISGETWTLTSSWTKYTHTFTTNTLASKTFGTANNDYLEPDFAVMWGDTIGDTYGLTGAETYVGSGTIDIAQVQLCAGEVALPFQPKSYAQELADCQRYCFVPTANAQNVLGAYGQAYSTTQAQLQFFFPVQMRGVIALTATAADWQLWNTADGATDVTAMSMETYWQTGAAVNFTVASGLTTYRTYTCRADASFPRTMIFESEL